MANEEQINITSYLQYADEEFFQITKELIVPASMLPVLETLQKFGISLHYDWSKSQGLDIVSRTGLKLGHVKVFLNFSWHQELVNILTQIAATLSK